VGLEFADIVRIPEKREEKAGFVTCMFTYKHN